MKLISFEEADPHLSWSMIAAALEDGHRLEPAKLGDLLLRDQDNSMLNRGAWIPGLGMALKSMTVFPANPQRSPPLPSIQGGVLLFDDQNGALKAVIDGILVTKWKTAGDSVLGARLLANPNPATLLIVGAGTVAHTTIPAYREIFPSLKTLRIWNRTRKNAEQLAAQFEGSFEAVEVFDDLAGACEGADLISSATMSTEPILKGEWISPGTHVDLIGAFRPDMREADDALISGCELFVDSRDTTLGHIGELEIPISNGVISPGAILGDLYELCRGTAQRSAKTSITVFKNGGGAHLDLMTSACIFQAVT